MRSVLERTQKRVRRLVHKLRRDCRLNIDVSNCNLRCVLCPRGGINGLRNESRGMMEFELFTRIVEKFVSENVRVKYLAFGNWGEPLLNPEISRMVSYAKRKRRFLNADGRILISTNLNHLPTDPTEFLESGIDTLRISLSGMTQEVYSKNHVGGNVEQVLCNILELAAAIKRRKLNKPDLHLIYSDLVYNKKDAQLARKFCDEHGLTFCDARMYICTVGDNI